MSRPSQPPNPDRRPLPEGWISRYSSSLQIWGYWNTKATPPCHTWVHPADPQPVNPDTRRLPHGWYSVYDPASERWAYVNTRVVPRSHALLHPLDPQPNNPDTRPLPQGWYSVYDPAFRQWLYINTKTTGPSSHVWVHPNDTPPPNQDNRPLPHGWLGKYDPQAKRWFYVNTTTTPHHWTWEHPLAPLPPPQSPLPQGIVSHVAKLATFGPENQVSPVVHPNGWLIANRNEVATILRDFNLAFPSNQDYVEIFGANPMYPRFMAYIVMHLELSGQHRSLLDSLNKNLVKWTAFMDIQRLASCRVIIKSLWEYGKVCVSFNRNETNENLIELLDLDVKDICAQLICVRDRLGDQVYAHNAQDLLDLLQAILDTPRLDPRIRPFIIPMITKLARRSGLYPKSLIVSGVRMGDIPTAGGSFGEIWKGEANGHPVAVKVLRVFETSDMKKLFKNFSLEIVVWRQLSHPNVLPFYGVHYFNGNHAKVCLISPWMQHGDIVRYLERTPDADKASLVQDIAQGLEYLHIHEPPIIHGDLKGVNILVTPLQRACIADFGLSRAVDTRAYGWVSSSVVGTLRWVAPEIFSFDGQGTGNTLASDIYALGCVFYEIFSGKPPFHEYNEFRTVIEVTKGNRPTRPGFAPGLDDEMWNVIEGCWANNPANRLTATDVVRRFFHSNQSQYRAPPIWEDFFTSSLRSDLGVYPAEALDASRLAPPGRPRVSATGQETFTNANSPVLAAVQEDDGSNLTT